MEPINFVKTNGGVISICKIHNWLIGFSVFFIAINFILLISLGAFAAKGDRHTAEEGFIQDDRLAVLEAKVANLANYVATLEHRLKKLEAK